MNWQENDLKVVEMRERIIELTNEFNTKKGTEIENYHQKLNLFLNRKLKKRSNVILAEHFYMSITSLKIPNSNI